MVIYCHPIVITVVILFYNTEWQQYYGMTINYCGKKLYNIGPSYDIFKMLFYTFGEIAKPVTT